MVAGGVYKVGEAEIEIEIEIEIEAMRCALLCTVLIRA